MTIDEAIKEWESKKRHMGCNSAADWFCKRVKGFYPEHLIRYTVRWLVVWSYCCYKWKGKN